MRLEIAIFTVGIAAILFLLFCLWGFSSAFRKRPRFKGYFPMVLTEPREEHLRNLSLRASLKNNKHMNMNIQKEAAHSVLHGFSGKAGRVPTGSARRSDV